MTAGSGRFTTSSTFSFAFTPSAG